MKKDIVSANELYSKDELKLKKIGFTKWKKLKDGSYECWGGFEGNPKNIPFKIKIFHGYFDCSWQELTSLGNCPEIVDGSFNCNSNRLETLKGCPNEVKGVFYCHNNYLKSLEYAPKFVCLDFDCSKNNLKSLKYGPKIVHGIYYCYSNDKKFTEDYVQSICKVKGKIKTQKQKEIKL